MMPKIITKEGEEMVVDSMSGRRYPPNEEALILGSIKVAKKEAEEAKEQADEPEIPVFLRP